MERRLPGVRPALSLLSIVVPASPSVFWSPAHQLLELSALALGGAQRSFSLSPFSLLLLCLLTISNNFIHKYLKHLLKELHLGTSKFYLILRMKIYAIIFSNYYL